MSPQPINHSVIFDDLTPRFQVYKTVDASPTDATETIIATLTLANFNDIAVVSGIRLHGWAALTVGTSGASVNLKIRQTNVSGTTICATGATTAAAGNLVERSVDGFDSGAGVKTYVLTATIASAVAGSTVSGLLIYAEIL